MRVSRTIAILLLPLIFASLPRPAAARDWLGIFGGREPAKASQNDAARRRQADFLNRIRRADPQRATIERAIFNEQNELGLVLARGVPMDSIPALMRSMLTQMAREFPGEDLTILAYAPSNPPMKIGTARLDARTRDMTYTPARR